MPPVEVDVVAPVAVVIELLAIGGGVWVIGVGPIADGPRLLKDIKIGT